MCNQRVSRISATNQEDSSEWSGLMQGLRRFFILRTVRKLVIRQQEKFTFVGTVEKLSIRGINRKRFHSKVIIGIIQFISAKIAGN